MRLPIDTQAVRFVTAGPAKPVIDFETKTQRVKASGRALFNVHLFAVGSGSRDSITVKVGGERPRGKSATSTASRSARADRAHGQGRGRDPALVVTLILAMVALWVVSWLLVHLGLLAIAVLGVLPGSLASFFGSHPASGSGQPDFGSHPFGELPAPEIDANCEIRTALPQVSGPQGVRT